MKTISSSRWIRPCSRRGKGKYAKLPRGEGRVFGGATGGAADPAGRGWGGSGKLAKWPRIESGLLAGVVGVVSEPTVMAWASLKRSSSPGHRWSKSRPISDELDWTTEANCSFPEHSDIPG